MQRADFMSRHRAIGPCLVAATNDRPQTTGEAYDDSDALRVSRLENSNLEQAASLSRLNEDGIRLFDEGRFADASLVFSQALHQLQMPGMASMIPQTTYAYAASFVAGTNNDVSTPGRRRRSMDTNRFPTTRRTRSNSVRGLSSSSSSTSSSSVSAPYLTSLTDHAGNVFGQQWEFHDNKKLRNDHFQVTSHQHVLRKEYDEGLTVFSSCVHMDATSLIGYSEDSPNCIAATLLFNNGLANMCAERMAVATECFLASVNVTRYTPRKASGHLIVASLHNIGYIQFSAGNIIKAIATFQEALHEFNTVRSCDNLHLAATLNCLGVLHFHLPRCETHKSLEYLQQALSIQRAVLGSDHRIVATTLNNIGRVLYMDGRFGPAMAAYGEALMTRRKVLGANHLDVAATIYNVGQTFHQEGNLQQALDHYKEFMLITVPQLGHSHRDVATILKCMAQIHQDRKDYPQALALYQQALQAAQDALGMHAEVASILNKIGNLYYEKNDHVHAIEMYQQGLEIERTVLDPHHPNITVTLSNIGQIYKECGDLNAAAMIYKQVLDIQLSTLPRNDAWIAITYSNLGLIHYQNRNHLAALEMYQEALRIRRDAFGDENLEVAASLNSIGLVLFKLGLFELSIQSFVEGLCMRRKSLGDTHRDVAIILYNIATVHLELGAEDDAMRCYQEALQVERKALGQNHLDLALTLHHISQVHQKRGEITEAIGCCKDVLRIQLANDMPDKDSTIVRTWNCLANLRLQVGDGAGVVEAMSEALRLARRSGISEAESIHLTGFHLYGFAKLHPESAAAA